MKIHELLEQTVAPVPAGQGGPLPATTPTEAPPNTSNTPNTNQPTGSTPTATTPTTTTPAPTGSAAAPNPNTPQVGKPMGANPQVQQGMKDTMANLDKIAAQIIGLKQQQQQLQQQIQTPTA